MKPNFFLSYFEKFANFKKVKFDLNKKDINRNNKLTYVGHSYHKKTKSTKFLIDYLSKYFIVREKYDNSWKGGKFRYPDLSLIKKEDAGIVFFQNPPPQDVMTKLKNTNLIFFPMYDGHGGRDKNYWNQYKNFKFINFSEKFHRKLTEWGLKSIHVKFFPKPRQYKVSKSLRIFFWQRTNQIDINTLEKLLGNTKAEIHIHRAIDPSCKFVSPTKTQEKKYNITYSAWSPNKKTIDQIIKSCNVYLAPRLYEGIGMSFLEAMAMGKAVIACNNPTMNEYIEHNKTGYLFDLNNIKPIDFCNLNEIRLNTHQYIKTGYDIWKQERSRIISFIRS